MNCADCGKPARTGGFTYGKPAPRNGYVVCASCRGKRAGAINRAKAAKHGPAYYSKTGKEGTDARRASR
jgi:hypothetical protein